MSPVRRNGRAWQLYVDGKSLMQTVLIMIHLMVVIALIGFVLLQRSEGGGLGSGQSGGAGFLSSRGTANVLTRTTAFLAIAFFATSLLLSALAGMDRKPSSILQGTSAPAVPGAPAPEAPLSGGGGLLDTLRGSGTGQGQQAPASPVPAIPQAPQSR